jgi:hypothetical protein
VLQPGQFIDRQRRCGRHRAVVALLAHIFSLRNKWRDRRRRRRLCEDDLLVVLRFIDALVTKDPYVPLRCQRPLTGARLGTALGGGSDGVCSRPKRTPASLLLGLPRRTTKEPAY